MIAFLHRPPGVRSPLLRVPLPRLAAGLITVQVFVAALAIAGGMVLHGRVDAAASVTEHSWLVEIAAESTDAEDRLADQALSILRNRPEIDRAVILPRNKATHLLTPWIGEEGLPELAMPITIEVATRPGAAASRDDVRDMLQEIPGLTVHGYDAWRGPLRAAADAVIAALVGLVCLVAAATIGTVVFATRFALGAHRETIYLLHVIGAEDGYIARRLAEGALVTGGLGGFLGAVAGGLAVVLLAGLSMPATGLAAIVHHLAALALLPLGAAVISYVTAWITVLSRLRVR